MRIKALILGEFFLLFKYGIVFLYVIFTAVYIALLSALPPAAVSTAATILVFLDPAAMGLFFMGAMVLLEKSQRVESSLAVAPIKTGEYIAAKVVPLMIIGVAVGAALCLFAKSRNIILSLLGVALSSVLFSLCSLIVGSNIRTLNSFMLAIVPFEIIICLPALLYLFGVIKPGLWALHPGVAAIRLISGDPAGRSFSVLCLALWCVPLYLICKRSVVRSFSRLGGAKL